MEKQGGAALRVTLRSQENWWYIRFAMLFGVVAGVVAGCAGHRFAGASLLALAYAGFVGLLRPGGAVWPDGFAGIILFAAASVSLLWGPESRSEELEPLSLALAFGAATIVTVIYWIAWARDQQRANHSGSEVP